MLHGWKGKVRGRTWSDLARDAGVEYSWLRSVASDKMRKPDAGELRKLAAVTGLDYQKMLDATGQGGILVAQSDHMAALVDLVTLQTEELKRLWGVQSQTVAALAAVAESLTSLANELRAGREEAPEWALAALQLARSLGPVEPSGGAPSAPPVSSAPQRRRR